MVLSLDGFATSLDGTHEWMFEWFGDDSNERSLRALEEAGVHSHACRSPPGDGSSQRDEVHWIPESTDER